MTKIEYCGAVIIAVCLVVAWIVLAEGNTKAMEQCQKDRSADVCRWMMQR